MNVDAHGGQERESDSPEATGGCEQLGVGAGNQTQALCKSSMCP